MGPIHRRVTASPRISSRRTGPCGPRHTRAYVLQVNGVEVAGEEVARPGDDGTALVRIGPTLS